MSHDLQTNPNASKIDATKSNGATYFVRPRVDVFENEAEYLIVADLPGVSNEAVAIRFDQGQLSIEALRTATAEGKPLAEEYRQGTFRRAFALPEGIDAEKIDAVLANGTLTVHVPKAAARRTRRIDVRA